MAERENYLWGLEKKSSCAPGQLMLSLCGDDLLTTADKKELIALLSGTKAHSNRATLLDKQTKSLILSGLICGITPMSIRRKCVAQIPDFVLSLPDGFVLEQRMGGCWFLKKPLPGVDNA